MSATVKAQVLDMTPTGVDGPLNIVIGLIRETPDTNWGWMVRIEARLLLDQLRQFVEEMEAKKGLGSMHPSYQIRTTARNETQYAVTVGSSLAENPSIVLVLPRAELDDQLITILGSHGIAAEAGFVAPPAAQPAAPALTLRSQMVKDADDPALWALALKFEPSLAPAMPGSEAPGLSCLWLIHLGRAGRSRWDAFLSETEPRLEIQWPPGMVTALDLGPGGVVATARIELLCNGSEVARLMATRAALIAIVRRAIEMADSKGLPYANEEPC